MNSKNIEVMYRCDECGELHDTKDMAYECCPPRVSEVFIFPTCGESHDTEESALDCCEENLDEDIPTRINPLDLEAAGQMRLIP